MGEKEGATSRGSVQATVVRDVLESWVYSSKPTNTTALARRLATAFPNATVRRGERTSGADVVVDDVAIVFAYRLTPTLRRQVGILAEQYAELVVYSTSCHTDSPQEWNRFKYRRGRRGTIQFVERSAQPTENGDRMAADSRRALVGLPVALALIAGFVLASLGLFDPGTATFSTGYMGILVALSIGVVGVALASVLAGRSVFRSLVIRLAQ